MNNVTNFEWVNPGNLESARKRLRLTPKEVAEQASQLGSAYSGITEKALQDWEAGKKEPELRHLEALSEIYVCPVGWFFVEDIPPSPKALDFRGVAPGAQVGSRGMQTLHRFLELADWSEEVAIRTKQFTAPALGRANLRDKIDDVVGLERKRLGFDPRVRSQWQLKNDAFDWWRRRIEALGVFCFVMRLPTSEVRGASYWGKQGGAFILVNSEDAESATGRLFTLLHEYAHLILHENRVCDFRGSREGAKVERFANRFAARMLVDDTELRERLKALGTARFRERWGDAMLDNIRKPFHVSRDVIAIYLEELELAPRGFYAMKRGAWANRRSFGRSKTPQPGHTQAEQRLKMLGGTLAKVLSSKQAEAELSPLDLAEMLDVKVERVPRVLDVFRQRRADS